MHNLRTGVYLRRVIDAISHATLRESQDNAE